MRLYTKGKSLLNEEHVIVHADKTVLKIRGIKVKGLNAHALEEMLTRRLQSLVRVIGVTGNSIDMYVYGIDEESILKDETGIIRALSLSEGITATELTEIALAEKIVPVDYDMIPGRKDGCAKERWHFAVK